MVKIEGKPRLCKLTMWSDFDGYGFNLHAEKSRPGQYVGKVDDGSPAEAAGLREGDRIIEVNGFNISSENHKHVVSRIKSIPNETDLLVVDKETDRIYRESGLVISSEDAIVISSAREEVATENEDRKSLESNDSSIDKRNTANEEESSLYIPTHGKVRSCHILKTEPSESFGFSIQTVKKDNTKFIKEITPHGPADRSGLLLDDIVLAVNGENVIEENHKGVVERIISRDLDTTLLVTDKDTFAYSMENNLPLIPHHEPAHSGKVEVRHHAMGSTGNSPSPRSTPSPQFSSHSPEVLSEVSSPVNGGVASELDDLNLNMTAAEMRERISSKKKRDPRKDDRMDILRKYQIIQTL
uniref:Na+/H+ exchange regulatory cofactor NHE-RF2 n=1 Tax=Caligus clemensi TaxID=344056 RepID=C1C296_CALCM|nr:Na+/H+ exchange regulatory cofactor NHE-RF2 [Caligus clemensi]